MTIQSAIGIASSGLLSVTQALAVTSQNVANASTPSYGVESAAPSALSGGGAGLGVANGPTTRDVDLSLEATVFAQNGEVAAQQTTSDALSQIDATQGTTAAGNDLASQVAAVSNAFETLSGDPANAAEQAAVVAAASTLTTSINATANAYQSGRQAAQNAIVTEVATLNTTLSTIGTLSQQIITAQSQGLSTADLANQRDAAESAASQLAGINFLTQANGGVVALAGGNQIDLQATTGPFAIAEATLGAGSTAPPLTLDGQDVTSSVTSGQIGANLTLRDTTLPAAQAGLDEFTQTLASRFANQGLTLFTNPAGAVPAGGGTPVQSTYIGFANVVQVNPAVLANNALVRDGTNSVIAGTGGAAAFTPNPTGGPTGFNTLINNVLNYALGANAQAGTAQTAPNSTGLGADGNISLNYQTSNTIGGFAANLVSAQSVAVNDASSALTTGTSLQSTLQAKLQSGSGVSIDTELSNLIILQNAYGANAKVLTALESVWTDLYTAVTSVQ
jgi:flagellar hook-associated protein 1 FlgK